MRRAVVMAALGLAACGVKAPPRPPERHAPGAHPEPAAAGTSEACGTCTVPSTPTPTASTSASASTTTTTTTKKP